MRSQSITTPPGSDPCRCALDGDERRRILLDARPGLHHGCGLAPAAQQAAGLELARVAARHVGGEIEERARAFRAQAAWIVARVIQRAFGHRPAYALYGVTPRFIPRRVRRRGQAL